MQRRLGHAGCGAHILQLFRVTAWLFIEYSDNFDANCRDRIPHFCDGRIRDFLDRVWRIAKCYQSIGGLFWHHVDSTWYGVLASSNVVPIPNINLNTTALTNNVTVQILKDGTASTARSNRCVKSPEPIFWIVKDGWKRVSRRCQSLLLLPPWHRVLRDGHEMSRFVPMEPW